MLKFIDQSAKRSYAASAYYAPNAARKNLAVITGAHVNKVILEAAEGDGVRATAVSFTVLEKEHTVYALNEIILSAGTVQSPQILELSGIGGAQILSKAGVKVVVDNPNVGENLQVLVARLAPALPMSMNSLTVLGPSTRPSHLRSSRWASYCRDNSAAGRPRLGHGRMASRSWGTSGLWR